MTDDQLAKKWGSAIRAQRHDRGMSAQDLATEVGVTRQAVYQWESGSTLPTDSKRPAIAEALGIHMAILFAHPERVAS